MVHPVPTWVEAVEAQGKDHHADDSHDGLPNDPHDLTLPETARDHASMGLQPLESIHGPHFIQELREVLGELASLNDVIYLPESQTFKNFIHDVRLFGNNPPVDNRLQLEALTNASTPTEGYYEENIDASGNGQDASNSHTVGFDYDHKDVSFKSLLIESDLAASFSHIRGHSSVDVEFPPPGLSITQSQACPLNTPHILHEHGSPVAAPNHRGDQDISRTSECNWAKVLEKVLHHENLQKVFHPGDQCHSRLASIMTPTMTHYASFAQLKVRGAAFVYAIFHEFSLNVQTCSIILTRCFGSSNVLANFVTCLTIEEIYRRDLEPDEYRTLGMSRVILMEHISFARELGFNRGFLVFLKYHVVSRDALKAVLGVLASNVRGYQATWMVEQVIKVGLGIESDLARFLVWQYDQEMMKGHRYI
jgi:hypothetical protein